MKAAIAAAVLALAVPPAALADAGEVAVSPDGRHVYATGTNTLTYARDAGSGALTLLHTEEPGGRSLAITGDGAWVYVSGDWGVHLLSRDRASGTLTHQHTWSGEEIPRGGDLTLSPDGRHLYLSNARSREIVTFTRNGVTGAIYRTGAVYGGPADIPWLTDPTEMAMPPDGRTLYVALGGGLGALRRDPSTGVLTPLEFHDGSTHLAVAASADGRRVYGGMGTYAAWEREPSTGALTQIDGDSTSGCGTFLLCRMGWSIVAAPNGTSVFSTGHWENTLFHANVRPGGVTPQPGYAEGQGGVQGMVNPLELAMSPDSRSLYVAAARYLWSERGEIYRGSPDAGGGAIVAFHRPSGSGRLAYVGTLRTKYPPRRRAGPTATIEDGATFTNDPRVTVTVTPPIGTASLRLASEPSFAGPAIRLRADGRYRFTLRDTGIGRDVRRVFVRFTDGGANDGLDDLSDDIILDRRRPALLGGTLARARRPGRPATTSRRKRSRLVVRARDNRSGVRRIQVAKRRSRPGRKRRFKRKLAISGSPRRVWVRVYDGAGNASRWKRVRRR